MATKVYTEATCDRCGYQDREAGGSSLHLMAGWGSVSATWLGSPSLAKTSQKDLCPACWGDLNRFFAGDPVAQPVGKGQVS